MSAHEVPPPVQMVQLLAGFQISQALYAAAVLGVADHLTAGLVPVGVLAGQAGAHAPSLARLLRTLASAGVFTEPEPGVFGLTPLGQTLTRTQAARFTGAMANLTDGIKAAAIPSLPLDGARTVVDVGGADGAMLAGFTGIGIRETGTPLSVIHATVAG